MDGLGLEWKIHGHYTIQKIGVQHDQDKNKYAAVSL
jgi:hypothetical protein